VTICLVHADFSAVRWANREGIEFWSGAGWRDGKWTVWVKFVVDAAGFAV
jgi:hypothetical protein